MESLFRTESDQSQRTYVLTHVQIYLVYFVILLSVCARERVGERVGDRCRFEKLLSPFKIDTI